MTSSLASSKPATSANRVFSLPPLLMVAPDLPICDMRPMPPPIAPGPDLSMYSVVPTSTSGMIDAEIIEATLATALLRST
jgi:hypothetical protein